MGNKIIGNVLWRFFERIGAQAIELLVTIFLARILGPEAFGNVAIMTAIVALLQVLVDGGLGSALIQKKDADELDYSSVFYFNIIFCILLYAILFFIAPFIAAVYRNSSFTNWIRAVGLLVIISGIKNVQQSIIAKRLEFKKFFFSTLIGTLSSAVVGIYLAIKGFGVWALIAQLLVNALVDTIVVFCVLSWKPKKEFSLHRTRVLLDFGWKILLSNLVEVFFGNYVQLMIGKFYSAGDLAFYNRGRSIPNVVVSNINTSIDSVIFPVMSNEQDNREKIRSIAKKAIITSTFIMAPLMMGIFFMSDLIVKVILGESWMPSVFYIRVFCVVLLFQPIHTININVLKALGKGNSVLFIELVKKIIGIIILTISMFYSMRTLAFTYMSYTFLNQLINSYPNGKLINYSYIEQIKDIMPSVLLAIIVWVLVANIQMFDDSIYILLILKLDIGVAGYLVGTWLFNKKAYILMRTIFNDKRIK